MHRMISETDVSTSENWSLRDYKQVDFILIVMGITGYIVICSMCTNGSLTCRYVYVWKRHNRSEGVKIIEKEN